MYTETTLTGTPQVDVDKTTWQCRQFRSGDRLIAIKVGEKMVAFDRDGQCWGTIGVVFWIRFEWNLDFAPGRFFISITWTVEKVTANSEEGGPGFWLHPKYWHFHANRPAICL